MGAEKMTDKDFKKLGRRDLLDIIYKLQLSEAQLRDENARLRKELEDILTLEAAFLIYATSSSCCSTLSAVYSLAIKLEISITA